MDIENGNLVVGGQTNAAGTISHFLPSPILLLIEDA